MAEGEYTQSPTESPQQDTLLERLKRIRAMTDNLAPTQTAEPLEIDATQFTNEFTRTVNILKQKAKTAVWSNSELSQSDRLGLIDLINSITIIQDEKLADLGNSELNLTVFVRRYLPKSEWPNYIPKINL